MERKAKMQPQVGRPPLKLPEILAAYERIIIIKAIQTHGGSRTRAADSLGVKRRHLYGRIAALGINLSLLPVRQGRPPKQTAGGMR